MKICIKTRKPVFEKSRGNREMGFSNQGAPGCGFFQEIFPGVENPTLSPGWVLKRFARHIILTRSTSTTVLEQEALNCSYLGGNTACHNLPQLSTDLEVTSLSLQACSNLGNSNFNFWKFENWKWQNWIFNFWKIDNRKWQIRISIFEKLKIEKDEFQFWFLKNWKLKVAN